MSEILLNIHQKLEVLSEQQQEQVLLFIDFLLSQTMPTNEYEVLLQQMLWERLESSQKNPQERLSWQELKQKLTQKYEI